MKKDLFIVSAPFAILSAIEAKHHFKSDFSVLIYFEYDSQTAMQHIEKAIHTASWNEIIKIPINKQKSGFIQALEILKNLKVKFETGFRNIFVGNIFTMDRAFLQKQIALNLKSEEIFLLDDGTLTLTISKEKLKFKNEKLIKKLRWKILGYKTNLNNFRIFTIFNSDNLSNFNIIQHQFTNLKKIYLKNSQKNVSNNFYFIGSPLFKLLDKNLTLIEKETKIKNILNKTFSYIKQIKKFDNIYYIPHRRCEKVMLEIVKKSNIKILKFDEPIELAFFEPNNKSDNIGGFFSTALFSLKALFEVENIYSFPIDLSFLNKNIQSDWQNIYNEIPKYAKIIN